MSTKRVLAAAVAALLSAGDAGAMTVLDQVADAPALSAFNGSRDNETFGRSQTFTVGVSGVLTRIDVALDPGFGPTPSPEFSPRLDLLATIAGVPSGGGGGGALAALGSVLTGVQSVDGQLGDFVSYDLSSLGLGVMENDVLAFQVFRNADGQGVYAGAPDHYARGVSYVYNTSFATLLTWTATDSDLNFRTYVDEGSAAIPLPAAGWLLLSGVGLMAAARRRAARS